MKNPKSLKYIAIVSFCAVLDMGLHIMTSKSSTISEYGSLSILARTIGAPAAAMLWIIIAFSLAAYVFYRYEDKIPGKKGVKGLVYGSAIGLLWLWGVIEGVPLSGNTFINETVMGLCDAVPIAVMGLLLGKFTAEGELQKEKSTFFSRLSFNQGAAIVLSVMIFSTVFSAGRFVLYFTKIMNSGYFSRPLTTIIWTFLMGTCIGVTYVLLGRSAESSSAFLKAAKFGMIIFGVNWAAFLVFIPMLYEGTLVDVIIRSTTDILLVIISYYLSELLTKATVNQSATWYST